MTSPPPAPHGHSARMLANQKSLIGRANSTPTRPPTPRVQDQLGKTLITDDSTLLLGSPPASWPFSSRVPHRV